MKVLVTGTAGNLGGRMAAALVADGHEVRSADFVDAHIEGADHHAVDMRNYETCLGLAQGMDAVLHIGGFHSPYLDDHGGDNTPRDFYDANVTGTFYMLDAARLAGVRRFVWASSVGVYEAGHNRLFGIYSLTKVLGEQLLGFYNREFGLSALGLRIGVFVPAGFLMRGFGMLGSTYMGNWIEPEEVVAGFKAALSAENVHYGVYDLQTPLPFSRAERNMYNTGKRRQLLESYWPEHAALFERFDEYMPPRMNDVDMRRTQRDLGYVCRRDFPWFLGELSRRLSAGETLD